MRPRTSRWERRGAPVSEIRSTPRIYKIAYRSAHTGRVVQVFAKVPYSGIFGLSDTFARAISTNQVLWYRVAVAKATEITPGVRAGLRRWQEALESTSARSGVKWAA